MATQLETQITIQAQPERIWEILMDYAAYPEWNPFVVAIAGGKQVGEALAITLQPPGGKAMKFTPKVVVHREASQFSWLGRLWMKGLFDGEHSFRLEALPQGGTRLHHSERFSGIMVPFLRKMINGATRKGFEAMNVALKARAEGART